MENIKDMIDKVMQEISDYGSSFKSTISELLTKGAIYDQVKWERDIAISQLNDLGIGFGEDVTKYKIAIENIPHMISENVMYAVCNTEWGLDARYVCPECLQPVEKEHKFCPHCGKALSWFNAPKPSAEVRNRLIASAKNGVKQYLRSTSSQYYYCKPYLNRTNELLKIMNGRKREQNHGI